MPTSRSSGSINIVVPRLLIRKPAMPSQRRVVSSEGANASAPKGWVGGAFACGMGRLPREWVNCSADDAVAEVEQRVGCVVRGVGAAVHNGLRGRRQVERQPAA